MACLNYQGKTKCGLHSVYYVLTDETIRTYCTTDDFHSCSEMRRSLKQAAKSQPDSGHVFYGQDVDAMRQAQRD
jgi:hypothetical protein